MCRILTVLTPVLGLVLALTDVALAERPNVIVIMTDDQGVGGFLQIRNHQPPDHRS